MGAATPGDVGGNGGPVPQRRWALFVPLVHLLHIFQVQAVVVENDHVLRLQVRSEGLALQDGLEPSSLFAQERSQIVDESTPNKKKFDSNIIAQKDGAIPPPCSTISRMVDGSASLQGNGQKMVGTFSATSKR